MSSFELSPDARQRLWRCYSLLLSLADEVDKKTDTNSELCESQESTTTKANELAKLGNDTTENEVEDTDVPEQTQTE